MALIEGTPADDVLAGGEAEDTLRGLGGNDTLRGEDGDDRLFGGAGDDLLLTGNGNDRAFGGAGNDTLRGGTGDHTLSGGVGDDWLLLGADDSYWSSLSPRQTRRAEGGDGDDFISTSGQHDADIFGGSGIDTLRIINFTTRAETMQVALTGPDAGLIASDGQRMTIEGIERLQFFADFGDQFVTGGDLDDEIHVGAGSNLVQAAAGDDIVQYRVGGANTLDGGSGNDILRAEALDRVPLYFVVRQDGTVDDGQLSQISGFERYQVQGQGRANDFISTGTGKDTLRGALGNDTLLGGGGRDRLFGGAGDDSLAGGKGRDLLVGGTGNDLLFGGKGNDTLQGGAGFDTLIGGQGADVFLLIDPNEGGTRIQDFESGVDQLHLRGDYFLVLGPNGSLPVGPLDPVRLSLGAAVGTEAQFVLRHDAGSNLTFLDWDANGADPSGGVINIAEFRGNALVQAADIWIV